MTIIFEDSEKSAISCFVSLILVFYVIYWSFFTISKAMSVADVISNLKCF